MAWVALCCKSINQIFMWWLPELLHESALKMPLWKKITFKAERYLLSTEISYYTSKQGQVPTVLILKLWCDAPHQTCCPLACPGLESGLWQQQSCVPIAPSAGKMAAKHRESWDIAMVQRDREGSGTHLNHKCQRAILECKYSGVDFLLKTWNFSEQDEGECS